MKILPLHKLDHHMREVLHGASIAMVMKGLGAILGFGFNLLLARLLGAEGAGAFFLAFTVITVGTVFGRVGLDNALLRFTASNAAVGDWGTVKAVYWKGMFIASVASAASTCVVFVFSPWIALYVFGKPELAPTMRWMALAIVPMSLQILHAEMFKGLKRIFEASLMQEHGIGVSALTLLGVYLLCQTWGVAGAVLTQVLASVIMALFGFWLWWFLTPQLRTVSGHFETRGLMSSSLPLFWVASINLVMNSTASFALGIWGTSADVGIFNVAFRTAQLTSFILIAMNSIVAPKFAALYRQGDMKALGSLARNSAKIMMVVAAPPMLLFLAFPDRIMELFGPKFAGNGMVLAVLAVGQFINVASGSVGYLLIMSGNERLVRNNIALTAIVNVILSVLLIPTVGLIGAAVGTSASLAIKNLIAVYLVWNRLRIQTLPLDWISFGAFKCQPAPVLQDRKATTSEHNHWETRP
jgi:O-antigen/teichoic acid export membrane protein